MKSSNPDAMPAEPPDPLEKPVASLLRALPERSAPGSLASRVQAELARRAEQPWWRKSYTHWPRSVQHGLHTGSALVTGLVCVLGRELAHGPGALAATRVSSRIDALVSGWAQLVATAEHFAAAVPTVWVYSATAAVLLGYITVLSLGALAYQLLGKTR